MGSVDRGNAGREPLWRACETRLQGDATVGAGLARKELCVFATSNVVAFLQSERYERKD